MPHFTSTHDLPAQVQTDTVVIFNSLADLVRTGQQDLTDRRRKEDGRASKDNTKARSTWAGSASLDEASELATNGWADGIGRIVNLAERISEQVSRRIEAHGMELWEEGGEVDVAAYLDGERACMWTWAEQDNKRPIVRVTVNIAAHSGITTEQYMFSGALAAALVDSLENAGRRVELQVHQTIAPYTGHRDNLLTVGANLKDANDPVDLGAIAYAVAHPSMLRRTLFSVEEHAPKAYREAYGFSPGYGYGYPRNTPEHLRGDVHIDLRESTDLDPEQAYTWILDRLREQGVEISE